ncbi:C40 family peptidase [Fodinicola feengrottensis]|uniref:C40 family peptidase n=1 Tax=Fodinicola feengrottensis TaxID=435914 RepID=UPI0036F3A2B7
MLGPLPLGVREGRHLPAALRAPALQYSLGTPISRSQLQPGDLVFWSYGSSWTTIHHVAIWAGNGRIIEAADFGIPVHRRTMYWGGYFGAVRLL